MRENGRYSDVGLLANGSSAVSSDSDTLTVCCVKHGQYAAEPNDYG